MPPTTVSYASPKIAKDLLKVFGGAALPVKVTMRASKDVSKFIRKVQVAHKKAAKSRLQFD